MNYDGEGTNNPMSPDSNDTNKIYSKEEDAWDQNTEQIFEQNPTWDDVRWLKDKCCQGLPLVVKGIMTAEDAVEAVNAGADGVMVSNHGGRGLDGTLASIDVLPEVSQAVGHKVPILLDSGIRRGTDVVKALALGATAVGIGKPFFFALAVDGELGVVNLLRMLQKETEAAMAICGCQRVLDIDKVLVTRHPSGGGRVGKYVRSKL